MNVAPSDLVFFAGGEALGRFGVFVARTAPAEDNAETVVRTAAAGYRDRAGIMRAAAANIPRPDMLDLDGDGIYETPTLLLGSADLFSYPFLIRPRALTVYVYYEERGVGGGIVHIGNAAGTGARLSIYDTAGTVTALHNDGTSSVTSALTEQPNLLDHVELLVTLSAAGVVQISRRVNGGSITAATASDALALTTSWADALIYINSLGSSSIGQRAYRSVKVALGTYVMDQMANAQSGAASAVELYPAADADDVWGWTEAPGEAEGIIQQSQGVLGVDSAFATGLTRVFDLNGVIVAVVDTVLGRATAYALASSYTGSGNWLDESGNAHHATPGAGAAAPLFLEPAGLPHLYLPTLQSISDRAIVPDAAALDITGDIDVRIKVALADYTPSATATLAGHTNGTTTGWDIIVNTAGTLSFRWKQGDGTARTVTTSAASAVTDGDTVTFRVTLDADDGAGGHVVKVYKSADYDPATEAGTWTQIGTDLSAGAFTTSIGASASNLGIGDIGQGNASMQGRVFAFQLYNGIAGTKVLDCNFSLAGSFNDVRTSFTAGTGQTVTINRAATGRKLVVVDRPLFLLGTDDYFEVTDHADLDFAASESFTVAIAVRLYGATADQALIAKKADLTTGAGYSLDRGVGGVAPEFTVADGAASSVDVAPTLTAGSVTVVAGRRKVSADQIEAFEDGTPSGSPTTDATTATLANAEALRIGRLSGAGTGYLNGEVIGWALFREALTDAQIQQLSAELTEVA